MQRVSREAVVQAHNITLTQSAVSFRPESAWGCRTGCLCLVRLCVVFSCQCRAGAPRGLEGGLR